MRELLSLLQFVFGRDLVFTLLQKNQGINLFFFPKFLVKALQGVSLTTILVTLCSFCCVSELLDFKNKLPGNKKRVDVIYAKQTRKKKKTKKNNLKEFNEDGRLIFKAQEKESGLALGVQQPHAMPQAGGKSGCTAAW